MGKSTILSLDNIYSSYGYVEILNGVSLQIKKGEIVSLLGRNGMGKSTTIKSICGILKPYLGKIEFNGVKINGLQSYQIARLGVGLVPEGRRIFSNLTVKENLVGSSNKGYWDLNKILDLFPVFYERLSQLSLNLSGGEQQMLAIGRALMTNPSLLILDEATEGLSPVISKKIWDVLRKVSNEGISILIIDKISHDLKDVSNYSYILERGKSVWDGKLSEISNHTSKRFLGI
ncbi:MAG: ABC transporter ATP-binding protein [Paracoccaceae bacterium]